MGVGALYSAISGITSSSRRIGVSAHNLANLGTEDFRPLESHQSSVAEGGSEVRVTQAEEPRQVEIQDEFVEQIISSVQAKASMRTIETELELIGSLLDIMA
jgi:flagellar hook protein FlgE